MYLYLIHKHTSDPTTPAYNACFNVSLGIPAEETRIEKFQFVFESICDDLFEQFEDQIGLAFYNNMSSQTDLI